MISRSILSPETNTVLSAGTFPQYRHHAIIEGAEVREVPLINGCYDLVGMLGRIDENTKIVWICNPNNPTGTNVTNEQDGTIYRTGSKTCTNHP